MNGKTKRGNCDHYLEICFWKKWKPPFSDLLFCWTVEKKFGNCLHPTIFTKVFFEWVSYFKKNQKMYLIYFSVAFQSTSRLMICYFIRKYFFLICGKCVMRGKEMVKIDSLHIKYVNFNETILHKVKKAFLNEVRKDTSQVENQIIETNSTHSGN